MEAPLDPINMYDLWANAAAIFQSIFPVLMVICTALMLVSVGLRILIAVHPDDWSTPTMGRSERKAKLKNDDLYFDNEDQPEKPKNGLVRIGDDGEMIFEKGSES